MKKLFQNNMKNRGEFIIKNALPSSSFNDLTERIELLSEETYYRVIYYDENAVLWDSRPVQSRSKFIPYETVFHNKHENESQMAALFLYIDIPFEFQNKSFKLRISVPYSHAILVIHQLELLFMGMSTFLLLIFSLLAWGTLEALASPLKKMVEGIKPYQEGKMETIPDLDLGKLAKYTEFQSLANTLISLSQRVKSQLLALTQERNEKEAILESLSEGIIAVDASLHIAYANFSVCRLLGTTKKQIIGKKFSSLETRASSDLLSKCHETLKRALEQHTHIRDSFTPHDGRKLHLDLIAAPIPHDKRAILVIQDNSNHYRVLEMGKDFIANASHELRTPITIIRGFAETLHDMPDLSKQMLKEITEKIVRNCHRMDTLVKNLLTLADLENLPLSKLLDCNICEILENCKHTIRMLHPEIEVELIKKSENIITRGSPDLLELAFMNLLQNAVKYSNPPARIQMTVSKTKEEIEIVFKDQGIGIKPQDIGSIFERFYTVNKARSRKLGGAGLGLSIVKTIIENHEGRIFVDSTPDVGTTFTIVLPIFTPL